MSRIDYIFCIIWIPPKTSSAHQALVKNRIHYPDSYKSTSPWLLDTPIPASCVFYPATSCCMSAAIAAMLLVLFHSVLRINFIAVLTRLCIHCTTLSIIVALSIPPLLNVVVRIHAVFRKVKPQGTGVVWSCTLYSTPNYNSKIIINCLYIYCYKCSLTLINKNKIVWGGRRTVFSLGIRRVSVFVDGFKVDVFCLLTSEKIWCTHQRECLQEC